MKLFWLAMSSMALVGCHTPNVFDVIANPQAPAEFTDSVAVWKTKDINLCIKTVKEFTNKTVLASDAVWKKEGSFKRGDVRWKKTDYVGKNSPRPNNVRCIASNYFGSNFVAELVVDGYLHVSNGYAVNKSGNGKDASEQIKKAVKEETRRFNQRIRILRAMEEKALENLGKPGANSNEIVKDVNSVIATWTRNN